MRLPISLFGPRPDFWGSEELIREELFSPDRLKQHGESLASAQPVLSRKQGGRQLSSRLRDDAATLLSCYRSIGRAVEDGKTITPAAEWIIDNYHIVEEQVFDIRGDLPPGYYRELPKLTAGPFVGLPRVFGVAWAYVAHTDSRFDPDLLCDFAEAYQRVQPLTIGELWAIPITLRFVLIENLRRAAERIVHSHNLRVLADSYADRILGLEDPPQLIAAVLADFPRPYPKTLIVQLAHRLRDPTPAVAPAVEWLEQQIAAEGRGIESDVQAEHTRQAGMNVTVRNIITSMREISAADWPDLFERISLVDARLRATTNFAALDFATRDTYRKRIEKLARRSWAGELEVAERVIGLASMAAERGGELREQDVGYYLVARGQATLEKAVGFRPSLRDRGRLLFRRFGVAGYIALCVFLAFVVLAGIVAVLAPRLDWPSLVLFALLAILPAVDLAATVLSRFILAVARPVALPALDLRAGVPPELKTMVVIPTLLSSPKSIEEVIQQLEIHYLSNASEDLTFSVLSDWTDASAETVDGDESLLRQAKEGIDRLNRRHPRSGDERFLILHRRRTWSETQRCWLGWERKRGKLQELNRLLRGATDTTFIATGGAQPKVPAGVRFVVTLDSDTRLPRETVRRLVGKLAHVLNQPMVDTARKVVTEGYGILQPRVTLALPHGSEGSWFQRVFSGAKGMDPYAMPVADVYQDLFGEGSFLGKGIYDVDAFEAAMEGRSPENVILSHDLFEGIFARAGLAGDIEIVEEFPRRYDVATSRQHRWARGDWQLLRWLFEPRRRSAKPAAATLLGRWKMLDNLRRTLSAPVSVMALIVGWLLLPPPACLFWSVFVLLALAAPALLPVLLGAFHVSPRSSWRGHFSMVFSDFCVALAQTGFVIATLVHQAWLMLDAIVRTLWRLAVSRKRLLEWTTAEQASRKTELTLSGFYGWMLVSVLVAGVSLVAAFANWTLTGVIALPFVLAWAAAPALAWEASRARPNRAIAALTPADVQSLRLVARRTWRFFEAFVTAEENWLPPDNFQEAPPQPVIAHRTSPTNIGLYLLSIVAARDFGWLGLADATDRLEATLGTMGKMFRFRGHFYNWYGTRDLRPLDPQYVSSVDSGNLAGHLIAVANACEDAIHTEMSGMGRLAGIGDAVALVSEAMGERLSPPGAIHAAFDILDAAVKQAPDDQGLRSLEPLAAELARLAREQPAAGDGENPTVWADAALASIRSHLRDTSSPPPDLAERLTVLGHLARDMAMQMDFRFLMDSDRQLMSIGYLTSESSRDHNCYDLLATEARLASFFAIAKGDATTKHWFRLGRATTEVERSAALVSWSGSMFEYLMPSLVMRAPSGSLLDLTNRLIVRRQIAYGAQLGVPWGISESAYSGRDLEFTYQYSNFGVPGLGLKRGLSSNTVIAPYATALAAMVDPVAAARNFQTLAAEGARGRFGYYEALDFTPSRLPEGARVAVVHNYMAHHQGMSIIAISNVLFAGLVRSRFHAEPIVEASELLLEERHPQTTTATPVRADEVKGPADVRAPVHAPPRQFDTAHTARPQSGLLSNTRYSVMVTNAGSGYSRWNNLAVTRWREDATLDDWGSYVYLRDVQDRRVWSAGYEPTCVEPESYSTTFTEDRVRIARRDRTVLTSLEIAVSAEDDAEVRRVSLTNMGGMAREFDVTSYSEVVLAVDADDVAHPAFSKMFIETEFVEEHGAILAHRRKRGPEAAEFWAAHFAVVEGEAIGKVEVETDRARFIGVGRDLRSPAALDGEPLSNSVGIVLDPIFSVRRRLVVRAGSTTRISFWTVVGKTRDAVLAQLLKYDDPAAFDRAGTLSWTHAQVQLRHIDLTSAEASLFQNLATCILFPERRFRAPEEVLRNPAFDVRALWAHGVSGDLPIVVLRLDSVEDIGLARELVLAHEYLRLKRLSFDLVVLNERGTSYAQDLQQSLEALVRLSETRLHLPDEGKVGHVFVLRNDLVTAECRLAAMLAARVILVGSRGSLSSQLDRFASGSDFVPPPLRAQRPFAPKAPPPYTLEFANGFGGFGDQGREYVATIENDHRPPAPWINVVANPAFGFQVAVDGASYTWSLNSRDNQITPWSNDPVVNRSGEVVYIRDDESGELWGPTAHPYQNRGGTYRARHGRGYSRFEHTAGEIAADLTEFVPLDDSVKIIRLKLRNLSGQARRLSVSAYVEWVLANSRAQSAATIVTEMSPSGALLARNARNQAYPGRVAFLALAKGVATWTGVRTEFLGRHGSTAEPAALIAGGPLSNRVGAGLDPCGALVAPVALGPNQTGEVVILLGDAESAAAADALAVKYRSADLDAVFAAVQSHWDKILGAIVVFTPDRSLDIMLNGWLLYQTLACRMWGRSGFYQASGAFGFRDQLQDCLALLVAAPALARAHILRAAARQFVEGDVQHWWLPSTGQGVRTRIADDVVWLAYAVAEYVATTGDMAILDEPVAFLEGPRLGDNEHDAFFEPRITEERVPLYRHVVDGLERSMATGAHGLPLMGGGDWNDGMNLVGAGGKGESVWLAWFLCKTLESFASIAEARKEFADAERWRVHARLIAAATEKDAWDGSWYRRAFFDDGTPLGSAENKECRIDSIAQSWAVISCVASAERARVAMAEAERQLVNPDDKLALLFTPPFDKAAMEPGYIKGYPPGLRENGGQYTHAAAWVVIAHAMQGEGEKAAALFHMINPISHALSAADVARYKVEPYVVAADVYAAEGHVGRGGWTWYTGSAGWLYQAGVEWILGIRKERDFLRIDPRIPASWPGYRAVFLHRQSRYEISVDNPDAVAIGVSAITVDGAPVSCSPPKIALVDDGKSHQVTVLMGHLRPIT